MKRIIIVIVLITFFHRLFSQEVRIYGNVWCLEINQPLVIDSSDYFVLVTVLKNGKEQTNTLSENNYYELNVNKELFPVEVKLGMKGMDYEVLIEDFSTEDKSFQIPDVYLTMFCCGSESLLHQNKLEVDDSNIYKYTLDSKEFIIEEVLKEEEVSYENKIWYQYSNVGFKRYYNKSNVLLRELNFKDNRLTGRYKENDIKGNVLVEGNFKDFLPIGIWRFYNSESKKMMECEIFERKVMLKKNNTPYNKHLKHNQKNETKTTINNFCFISSKWIFSGCKEGSSRQPFCDQNNRPFRH